MDEEEEQEGLEEVPNTGTTADEEPLQQDSNLSLISVEDIKLNLTESFSLSFPPPSTPAQLLQPPPSPKILKSAVIKLHRIDDHPLLAPAPRLPERPKRRPGRPLKSKSYAGLDLALSGLCVICGEDFSLPEEVPSKVKKSKSSAGPKRSKKNSNSFPAPQPTSKDFRFILEKCLEASEGECRRLRTKDGYSQSFCPEHAKLIVEARAVAEQLENLEKLLSNLKKTIRNAVVESFLLESNSFSSSNKSRQYTNLRKLLREGWSFTLIQNFISISKFFKLIK